LEALGGIAFVQVASSVPNSSNSVATTFAKAQGDGDLNVVAVCWNSSSGSLTSVTDTMSNVYAVAAPVFALAGEASCATYCARNIKPAAAKANVVTVKWATSVSAPDVRIAEYSGVGALDVSAAASGTGTAANSGGASTTASGDLVLGLDYIQNSTTAAGSGFTSRVITTPDSDILEDKVAGAPGSYGATATTNGGWWVMQMVAFKAASLADAGADAGLDAGIEAGLDGGSESAVEASDDAAGHSSPDDASDGDTASDAATVGSVGKDGGQAISIYPLTMAPNKGYLVDNTGAPWFMQGDSAWELVPGLDQADTLSYLSDRQSRGYNAIIVQVMEHKFTTHNPPWLDVYGNPPFTRNLPGSSDLDFTAPDEAYFKNLDFVLQQANARGIAVLLFPSYLGYICQDEGWCETMGENGVSRMVTYGTYLGNRYKNQPNIIWVLGGDDTATGSVLSEVTGIANGIRAAGDTHLMTAHWATEESAADNSLASIPWLQIDTLYTYKDQSLYTKAQSDYARDKGVRPEFLIEADYEGEHPGSATTSDTWRAQMYEPALAGSMGFVFGNNPLWFYGTLGDGNAGWALATSGSGFTNWRLSLPSPGSMDGLRAGTFFRSIAWQTLVPDTTGRVLTSGNAVVGAASPDGKLAAVYLSEGGSAGINLSAFVGPVAARWYDPSAGTFATITGSPFTNTGSHTFASPGKNRSGESDWVLLLKVGP
jgi:hypothetical protein